MDRLNTLLSRVLHKRGIYADAAASLLVYRAEGWLTEHVPELRSSLHVLHVKNGCLTIAADNSIAAQECNILAEPLIEALKAEPDACHLERISVIRSSGA